MPDRAATAARLADSPARRGGRWSGDKSHDGDRGCGRGGRQGSPIPWGHARGPAAPARPGQLAAASNGDHSCDGRRGGRARCAQGPSPAGPPAPAPSPRNLQVVESAPNLALATRISPIFLLKWIHGIPRSRERGTQGRPGGPAGVRRCAPARSPECVWRRLTPRYPPRPAPLRAGSRARPAGRGRRAVSERRRGPGGGSLRHHLPPAAPPVAAPLRRSRPATSPRTRRGEEAAHMPSLPTSLPSLCLGDRKVIR